MQGHGELILIAGEIILDVDKFFAATYDLVDTIKSSEDNFIAVVYDKRAKHLCVMKRRALRSRELYKILKACDNPRVPQIYRLFEHDGALIVIEEHIDGQTLEEMLAHRPSDFDEAFVMNIFEQLCDCLMALHSVDIIHRDIKPSNIMLTKGNVVKLIDFGIARLFKPDSHADTEFLGTRGYAAPEQFGLFDLGQTDARTDIHALAVTVKQLLGDDYNGRLLPVLNRCMSLNPNDRYQSVGELIRAVERTRKLWYLKRFLIIAALISIAFALPQLVTFDEPIEPPPVEINVEPTIEEEPTMALYINGELSPNRSPHSTAGDIDLGDEYRSWRRDERGNYLFPADWTAKLTIQNHTERDLRNPTVKVDFDGDEIIIEHTDIKAGQTVDIEIPIANRPALSDDYGQLSIALEADDEDLPILIRDLNVES